MVPPAEPAALDPGGLLELDPAVLAASEEDRLWSPALGAPIEASPEVVSVVRCFRRPRRPQALLDAAGGSVRRDLEAALATLVEHGVLCPVHRLTARRCRDLLVAPRTLAEQERFAAAGWADAVPLDLVTGELAAAAGRPAGFEKGAERPPAVVRRSDGRWLIAGDTGGIAAAVATCRPVLLREVPPEVYFRSAVDTPGEFFGTARTGAPYQAVFAGGRMRLAGIRSDLEERMQAVQRQDLVGRRVLDLGSNVGMASFLACAAGARSAWGVDRSPALLDAAVRLNAWFAAPCRFRQADLALPLPDPPPADTVFVFALLGHLPTVDGVLATVHGCGARVVYVEGHGDFQGQGEIDRLLAWEGFCEIEFLGHGSDNNPEETRTRRRYRCLVGTA